MELGQTYVYSSSDTLPHVASRTRYNPRLPPINSTHQLPACPVQSNLYPKLPTISRSAEVMPMKVAPTANYVVPVTTASKSTSSTGLKPCAMAAIVVVTLAVIAGICTSIVLGVINATTTFGISCEFSCNSGTCISSSLVCDGHADCAEGEDEASCASSCSGYQCSSGTTAGTKCISSSKVCDGISDCSLGEDESNCPSTTTTTTTTCSSNEFHCTTGSPSGYGGSCISSSYRCDSFSHCFGGEDEDNCNTCSSNEFHCTTGSPYWYGGSCISSSYRCDSFSHCFGGEDEDNCDACSSNEFHCTTGSPNLYGGTCISSSYRCDSFNHCYGGEDEDNCDADACSASQFTCVNGGIYGNCIPSYWECDNINDCTGNTDEQNCGASDPATDPNKYQCPDDATNTEISKTKVCDGSFDCPGGADEDRCIIMPNGNSNGEIKIYSASTSTYRQICSDDWTTSHSDALCVHLGYSSSMSTNVVSSTEVGLLTQGTTFDLSALSQETPTTCPGNQVVKIVCIESTSCGSSSRIVGGEDALIAEYPWQISFQKFESHICGGTIITKRWVVTAPHCVESGSANSAYRVVTGITNLTSTVSTSNVFPVSRIVSHPLYTNHPVHMDIALIYVSNNIMYSNTVQPACLPATGQTFADQSDAHVTGWGATSEGGSSSNILQTVIVPLYNTENCTSIFTTMKHSVKSGNVCAGIPTDGGKDSCQGDSGGPLVIRSEGRDYLVGVTSWGVGCARPDYPGVYAEVSYFKDWINREVAKES